MHRLRPGGIVVNHHNLQATLSRCSVGCAHDSVLPVAIGLGLGQSLWLRMNMLQMTL